MINTDRYDIDNNQIIGRLLPWWIRGRKTILFLSAISYPIVALHKIWQYWALERLIEAKTTSQARSLAWYLNYKLRSHFKTSTDSFDVDSSYSRPNNYIFFFDTEWRKAEEYTSPVKFNDARRIYGITVYNLSEDTPSAYVERGIYTRNTSEDEEGDVIMYQLSEDITPSTVDNYKSDMAAFPLTIKGISDISIEKANKTKLITVNLSESLEIDSESITDNEFNAETYTDEGMITYSIKESQLKMNCIIIYAPLIEETDTYTFNDYKFDILKLAIKYITNQQVIYIIYNERISN